MKPHFLRVGELAQRLAIHQTTASNLLDALVCKGSVLKERDAADQRAVRLALSEQGKELIERAPKPARGLLPQALRKMNPAGLADLNNGLRAPLQVIDHVDEAKGLQPLPFTM